MTNVYTHITIMTDNDKTRSKQTSYLRIEANYSSIFLISFFLQYRWMMTIQLVIRIIIIDLTWSVNLFFFFIHLAYLIFFQHSTTTTTKNGLPIIIVFCFKSTDDKYRSISRPKHSWKKNEIGSENLFIFFSFLCPRIFIHSFIHPYRLDVYVKGK